MAVTQPAVFDRVRELATVTGTGPVTVAVPGAANTQTGYQNIANCGLGNGATTYLTIVDRTTGDWETSISTFTYSLVAPTLARTSLLSSSTGGFVSFAGNACDLVISLPASVFTSLVANSTPLPIGISGLAFSGSSVVVTASPVHPFTVVDARIKATTNLSVSAICGDLFKRGRVADVRLLSKSASMFVGVLLLTDVGGRPLTEQAASVPITVTYVGV